MGGSVIENTAARGSVSQGVSPDAEACAAARAVQRVHLRPFSRRGFLALAGAVGLSSCAPFWEGLFVRAYATETGGASYRIYVAKRWEVPFAIVDMSDATAPKAVADASITLTSLYNGAVATGKTDASGTVFIDITALSEPPAAPDSGLPTEYAFYGTVLVEAEGYRAFETGRMRIVGGQQVETATHPLDGRPYLQLLTVAGWDVQYASSTTFAVTETNRNPYELAAKVVGDTGSVEVTWYQENGATLRGEGLFQDGVALVKVQARCFSAHTDDASAAFAPGERVHVRVGLPAGQPSFTAATKLVVAEGVMDDAQQGSANLDVLNTVPDAEKPEPISLYDAVGKLIPFFEGNTVDVGAMLPFLPIEFQVDPHGLLAAGVNYENCLYSTDQGEMGLDNWFNRSREDIERAYRDAKNRWDRFYSDFKDNNYTTSLLGGKPSKVGRMPLSKSFTVDFECAGTLFMKWGDHVAEDETFHGTLSGFAQLACNANFTQQIMVGYVPLFLAIDFDGTARALLDVGMGVTTEGDLRLGEESTFDLTFVPKASLSLGVGIAGYLSAAVRGSGYLSFYLGVPMTGDDKPLPHYVVGSGLSVGVAVQALMFKTSVDVHSVEFPSFYDNWNEGGTQALKAAGAGVGAGAEALYVRRSDGSAGYAAALPQPGVLRAGAASQGLFAAHAVPVEASELAASAEFRAVLADAAADAGAENAQSGDAAAVSVAASLLGDAREARYAYEPIPRNVLRALSAPGTRAVQALGSEGALVTGGVMYEDVFSDPRIKVVSANGVPWLLRILTVSYPGEQVRTRLAVAKWNGQRWDAAMVVEFGPAYVAGGGTGVAAPARDSLYDYDFDAVGTGDVPDMEGPWADGGVVRVFLTSGTRAAGEADTPGAAMAHTVGTFLSLREDGTVASMASYLDTYRANPYVNEAGACSTLVYPNILCRQESGVNVTAVLAFCRMADAPEALVNGPYREYPATALYGSDGAHLTGDTGFNYTVAGDMSVRGGAQASASELVEDAKHAVAASFASINTSSMQVQIAGHYIAPDAQGGQVAKEFIVVRNMQQNASQVAFFGASGQARFVYPWHAAGRGGALCATEEGLVSKTVSLSPDQVVSRNVSLAGEVNLGSFALDDETGMLYYATVREGTDPGVPQLDGTRAADEQVADYRIWASRYVKDGNGDYKFMEPFSLAKLDQPIDALAFVDLGDAYGFVVNSLTSLKDSMSRISFFTVPYIKHVELLSFSSVNSFVCAGAEEPFCVTVRNDGNVALDGFTVVLAVGGATYRLPVNLADAGVVPLPDAQDARRSVSQVGERATFADEVLFDAPTEAGVLNPGKTRAYRFTWKVPEELSGQVEVKVSVAVGDLQPSANAAFPETLRMRSAVTADQLGLPVAERSVGMVFRNTAEQASGSVQVSGNAYRYEDDAAGGSEPSDAGVDAGAGANGTLQPSTGDSLASTAAAALLAALGLGAAATLSSATREEE